MGARCAYAIEADPNYGQSSIILDYWQSEIMSIADTRMGKLLPSVSFRRLRRQSVVLALRTLS